MTKFILWLPLALFALLVAVVASGVVQPKDTAIHSQMVDKTLPQFALDPMVNGKPGLSSADYGKGGPRLLNVFASWCLPCIAEAPQLIALEQRGVPIDAIAVRDDPADVRKFLARNGDPYARIGDDARADVQLALGSSGVPETFVIGADGHIVAQHIGAIRPEDIPEIMHLLEKAQ
ncbi:redoxin family protein [Stakelama saccharophila]|uniref:Redoxin family protein n=1 Tax=Stakelama saccharophila TaxID=3075605 RepID=A0ABZ0B5U2_9SPHN|nr:redoxin family protein [Stakelama sp. W311]WNO52607.1 redoxin family protein [Stakelama sp. W311]